jgi:hypothetical protein
MILQGTETYPRGCSNSTKTKGSISIVEPAAQGLVQRPISYAVSSASTFVQCAVRSSRLSRRETSWDLSMPQPVRQR